eukprot:13000746-Alexandrium_andersonii.AAC.1
MVFDIETTIGLRRRAMDCGFSFYHPPAGAKFCCTLPGAQALLISSVTPIRMSFSGRDSCPPLWG